MGTNNACDHDVTQHSVILGGANNLLASLANGTTGQLLQATTSNDPTWTSTLSSTVQGNITSVGTITSGTWNGTTIAVANGGTGAATLTGVLIGNGTSAVTGNAVTQYDVLVGGASNAISSIGPGTSGQVLQSAGNSANPAYTTATYPSDAAKGDLIYGSATHAYSQLAISTFPGSQLIANDTGVPIYFNPRNSVILYDDFVSSSTGGVLNWNTHTSGSGGFSNQSQPLSTNPGTVKLYVVAVSDIAAYSLSNSLILGGGYISQTFYIKLNALSNGTDRYIAYIGLNSSNSTGLTDGVWFQYSDNVNSGNWQIVTSKASSATTANTSTAADTNFHRLRIDINAAGSSIAYYIDDVQVANSPISTNIPIAAIGPWVAFTKTVGASQVNMNVDYFWFFNDLTTSR